MKSVIAAMLAAFLLNGCYALRQLTVGPDPDPPSAATGIMAEAVQFYPDGTLKSRTVANREGFSAPTCPQDEPCEVKLATNHEGAGLDVTYRFQGVNQELQATQQGFNNQITRQQIEYNRAEFARIEARFDALTRGLLEVYGGKLPANVASAILGMPIGPPQTGPDG